MPSRSSEVWKSDRADPSVQVAASVPGLYSTFTPAR